MRSCVIIAIIQAMYAGSVGGCSVKIKDFSHLNIRNHLSLHLLLSIHLESGKTNTCFISSSSTWVIDSGATDHMIGNSSLLTTFQSHPSTFTITLAYGSTSCVLGSRTIHLTPLITLTSVLSLPQFSFNLISVSKLTRTLNCSITFFLNYCLIQNLSTKQIIGRGCEFEGLYILDTEVSKYVTCSGVVTPFKLHCRLGHPSLSLL